MPRLKRVAVLLFLNTMPALAHHSWAPYDLATEVRLEGVVTEYTWANPHSYIHLQTTDADGSSKVWEIEASSAVIMRNRGWSADTIAVGDRVTVYANPANSSNRTKALGARLQRPDGLLLEMRQANRGAPAVVAPEVGTDSLAGLWRSTITPEIREHFFFFEPTDWPLTAAGLQAFETFEDDDNPGKNCVPYASPFLMIIPDAKQITLGKDTVVIHTELENAERIIHLDVNTHEGVAPSVQGHSIGRWEDKVLVVDTARFAEQGMGNAQKLGSGPDKHLTERFALSPDGKSISYSFELSDPDVLAAPVSYQTTWVYAPDFDVIRLPCNPESAQRFLDIR